MGNEVTEYQRNAGLTFDQATFFKARQKLPEILQLFGFPGLRKGQDAIINNILAGRDTLGFIPTSGGKSFTYIAPTYCLGYRTIIFSPLVALMKDQVQSLWKRKMAAAAISSGQTDSENINNMNRWVKGEIQFLFVAPERLANQDFMRCMRELPPDMAAIDEAHSASSDGDNFRPAYAKIGYFIRDLNPKVVLALTATATEEVETDIRRIFGIQNAFKIAYLPVRENLKFKSEDHPGDNGLLRRMEETDGSYIVYCATKVEVERLGKLCETALPDKTTIYHGGMGAPDKNACQDLFMSGEAQGVIATKAFGMGIDKANIRAVYHNDIPGSIEAYTQESGRAGRDGLDSLCLAFFQEKSFKTQQHFIDSGYPSEKDIRLLFAMLQRCPVNAKGEIVKTVKDMSYDLYGNQYQEAKTQAALSIMQRHGVVERPQSEEKIGKVSFSCVPDDLKQLEYHTQIVKIGKISDDGMYAFDIDLLRTMLGVGEATVVSNLKKWETNGHLRYVAPFRGKPTRIIGNVDKVEFARIKAKHEDMLKKLKMMREYFTIPDEKKAEFLSSYFDSVLDRA